MRFRSVLMVCIGNICRSPMAEACLRRELERTGSACRVASAGLQALVGHPADRCARDVALEHGLDLSAHRARQLDVRMVRDHDLILVMEQEQVDMLLATYPFARGRVHRLGRWLDQEISDPYRRPREYFERAYERIQKNVEAWLERL